MCAVSRALTKDDCSGMDWRVRSWNGAESVGFDGEEDREGPRRGREWCRVVSGVKRELVATGMDEE